VSSETVVSAFVVLVYILIIMANARKVPITLVRGKRRLLEMRGDAKTDNIYWDA
jgi:hypothetical protein